MKVTYFITSQVFHNLSFPSKAIAVVKVGYFNVRPCSKGILYAINDTTQLGNYYVVVTCKYTYMTITNMIILST